MALSLPATPEIPATVDASMGESLAIQLLPMYLIIYLLTRSI
jgi:hypothetical protein